MTTPPADPLVGTTVAQYEVLAKLGGGGMGVVYTARDTRLGRLVALKFLPPQWSHDEAAKQRFMREAQAASATDHPNICTIHDIAATADGRLFLVMAHYEGRTLKQMLEDGPLEIETAVEIAAQVAEGLAKAHAAGVIHRDIKPGNIMIAGDVVKILDFGLAKFANALQLTVEGSTIGTAAYMSPEQVKGEEADARSDVWALGVVLYEMLAGRVPFQGAYAEAVGYAIRHESPIPLRTLRPGVPEALEQVVFRALHKEPSVRYGRARDMAGALRQLQGRTMAQDLLTQPLPASPRRDAPVAASPRVRRPRWRWIGAAIALAIAVAMVAGVYWWIGRPADRVPLVVAPVVNQTGYAELDSYRLALTNTLLMELGESSNVRVLPYARLIDLLQRFFIAGSDISSREAVRELSVRSGARYVVVPSLLYENGAWTARAAIQDAQTAVDAAVVQTPAVASALAKDAAYDLSVALATAIEEHFERHGPGARVASRAPSARLRTLDAARAFQQGLTAYEQLEYAAAQAAFARAADEDPQHPLPQAWLSRVAQIRRDTAARTAAEAAWRAVTETTPESDRLFVQAVLAEARRDPPGAAGWYRALVERFPDEPSWLLELAAFQDRQGDNDGAIATLQRLVTIDAAAPRADTDLCRLYNRVNDRARAREHATRALTAFRARGALEGAGQALFCLVDTLRVGSDAEIVEARQHAAAALEIFENLRLPYNLARANNYVALAAEAQGRLADAAAGWERALPGARETGNSALESAVLLNLGVTHEALGNRRLALQYYRDSFMLAEKLGNQRRAAQSLVNAAGIRIGYGDDPDQGYRDVQSALAVFQALGDRNFELFCRQLIGAYYRNTGRHAEAERELRRALALAGERELTDEIPLTTVELARTFVETGRYADAHALLAPMSADVSGRDGPLVLLRLAQVRARLGDVTAATADLERAAGEIEARGDGGLRPLLLLVQGDLAYERGDVASATQHLGAAAELWRDDAAIPPDSASLEALGHHGLLLALAGDIMRGEQALRRSLALAQRARFVGVEAWCRVWLARILASGRRGEEAIRLLDQVLAVEGGRVLGPELEAQARYWRAVALEHRLSGTAEARAEADAARRLLRQIGDTLPPQYKQSFGARPDIRAVLG